MTFTSPEFVIFFAIFVPLYFLIPQRFRWVLLLIASYFFYAYGSGIYNLGSGEAHSFNELVEVLNKSLGTDLQPEYIDNPHAHYQNFTQADLKKIKGAIGYKPNFTFEAGVKDYMDWLYSEGK